MIISQNGGIFMVKIDEKVYGKAKASLEMLFDTATFVELGAYTKRTCDGADFEGVICGYGAVNGKLTFAFAQESGRAKGSFSERHYKKIANLYELAVKNGAPVVGVFDSAGAVVYDGAEALASYGRFMKLVSDASGIIPQIAVINGICGGSSALIASMFDITLTLKGVSKFFVNSPFVVGECDTAKSGISAFEAESESELFGFAKTLVCALPSNNADGAYCENGDDMNRAVSFDASEYSAETLVKTLSDNGSFIRLYSAYTENAVLGFASFGGITVGVAASEKGAVLDINTARAMSRLISFCDSFAIPVLTLVDSVGLDLSLEAEKAAYASELARLAYAYTASSNAKLTVVVGKAYGAAFTLLGSKALGADMAYALPDAQISVLSPEASVAFVWNDRVGEQSREELEAEWKEKCASASEACYKGEIDDIVKPEELRARICAAFSMLASKAEGHPTRRHANMPL